MTLPIKRTRQALRLLPLSLGVALAFAPSGPALAQGAPAPQSSFPTMPAVFDRATVQGLLDNIDKDRNDIVLWGGYFVRNGTKELTGQDGRELLDAALDKAPAGSLPWLKLQYLNTFYLGRYVSGAKALEAYGETFAAAETAQAGGKASLAQSQMIARLVEQFVNSLPVDWFKSASPQLKSRLLAQVFRVWNSLPDQDSPAERIKSPRTLYELNWKAADEAAGGPDLAAEMERALAAKPVDRQDDARLLMAAAEVLSEKQAERSLELIRHAREHLPQDGKPQTKKLVLRLHDDFVEQLARVEKWDEALRVQRAFIADRGWGYNKLLDLLLRNNRDEEAKAVIAELCRPEAEEKNAVGTARFLLWRMRFGDGRKCSLWAKDVLRCYLETPRARTVAWELTGRALYAGTLRRGQRDLDPEKNKAVVAQVEALLTFDEALVDKQSTEQRQAYDEFLAERRNLEPWEKEMLGSSPAPGASAPTTSAPSPAVTRPVPLPAAGSEVKPVP